MQLSVAPLRDQIAAPARTILLVLLAAAAVVFVIACSNVANLILARSVRREGELAVRAALGASTGALRRTLLAESLVLCGAGAMLGVLLARPLVGVVGALCRALLGSRARRDAWTQRCSGSAPASRWLAAVAARLRPAAAVAARRRAGRCGPASGGVRITPGTNRRLRVFAIDADRVLVRAARRRRHAARRRSSHCRRRAPATTCGRCSPFDVPLADRRRSATEGDRLLRGSDAAHRAAAGRRAASRSATSCRGATPAAWAPASSSPSRATRRRTVKRTRTRGCACVAPGFFAALGVPLVAGRDFTDDDRARQRARW